MSTLTFVSNQFLSIYHIHSLGHIFTYTSIGHLTGTHRVEGDQGNRPDSLASVVGGQASHAPPVNEPKQLVGGTMGILQQLAQALQRAGQPTAIAP